MKILVASSIDPAALETLGRDHDVICAFGAPEPELKTLIADREILVFRSGVTISADVLSAAPDLQMLVRAGSGLDNLDVATVRRRQLTLVRVPEPGAKAVAELAFVLMLTLSRQVLTADRLLREGRWAKYELDGHLLTGRVLGIYGAGNIGSHVGELGAAWGMDVVGCVEFPDLEVENMLAEKGIRLTTCDEVVATADYLSFHVSLKDNTRNLINAPLLARMKSGSYLINTSRGGVTDEEALLAALKQGGRLAGAALDVHNREGEGEISPLAALPNVVLTPHIGAMTIESQREIGVRVVRIVEEHVASLAGQPA